MDTSPRKKIPGTDGFYASQDGYVYGPKGNRLSVTVNRYGYQTVYIKPSGYVGRGRVGYLVNRLVALAWCPYEGDPHDLVVNHIDGNRLNNAVSNLEWVTSAVNNLHASLIRKVVERPTIYMVDEEDTYSYIDNLWAAVDVLGLPLNVVWGMVRDGTPVNGKRLYPITTKTVLPKQLVKPNITRWDKNGDIPKVAVKIKDLVSGAVCEYESMGAAARFHRVSASHIYQMISTPEKVRIFQKEFMVVHGDSEFPEIDPKRLNASIHSSGIETWGWNSRTSVLLIATSASKFLKLAELDKNPATKLLKARGYGNVGEWYFAYEDKCQYVFDAIRNSSSA